MYSYVMYIANATHVQLPIQVRLANGDDKHEGRVEILYAGLWGTICGDFGFDLSSANVICRQLGYPGAVRVARYLEFDEGDGQIWLTYLDCTGSEPTLEQCFHSGFGTGSCLFEDIGVECLGLFTVSFTKIIQEHTSLPTYHSSAVSCYMYIKYRSTLLS